MKTGENRKMSVSQNWLSPKEVSAGRKRRLRECVGASNAVAVQLVQGGLKRLRHLPVMTDAKRSNHRFFILPMRRALLAILAAVLAVLVLAVPAGAEFGLEEFEVGFEDKDGQAEMQAGSHPFAMRTFFEVETDGDSELGEMSVRRPLGLGIKVLP